jgi:hypothetical protein
MDFSHSFDPTSFSVLTFGVVISGYVHKVLACEIKVQPSKNIFTKTARAAFSKYVQVKC